MISDRLHIGMVVPPYYAVPPEGYGGTETTVSSLVDAMVELGHRFSPSVIARRYEQAYVVAISSRRSSWHPLRLRDLSRLVLRPKSLIALGS